MEVQLDLQPIKILEKPSTLNKVLIAGPCSAESKNQLFETANALKKEHIDLFRAGIWKPRTRPGEFQGLGSKALQWLKEIKELFNMPVTTEVANEKHVYEALKYGIDILWIGARTTTNPFAVEEIARALEGTNTPVMIKSPVNPDLNLWLGALERLNRKGIKQLAVIHRGFSSFNNTRYRNPPEWNIPLKLKSLIPNLPVINDPSHISGNRALVHEISSEAIDRKFDGLMIEVHPEPDKALSDAKQQITPQQFHNLMIELNIANTDNRNTAEIENIRKNIDYLDNELLDLIIERMRLTLQIGYHKKNMNLPVYQKNRWKQLLYKRIEKGKKQGLDRNFVKTIFKAIHNESMTKQKAVKKSYPHFFEDLKKLNVKLKENN
jgi:chorismate mutase